MRERKIKEKTGEREGERDVIGSEKMRKILGNNIRETKERP